MRDTMESRWQATLRRFPFPQWLDLRCVSNRPPTLPEASRAAIMEATVRLPSDDGTTGPAWASVIVPTFNQQVMTRLCLGSLLAASASRPFELLVVDNGSSDGTPEYLRRLARRDPRIRPIFNRRNRGFAAANNQAFRRASGEVLVLLNNDTVVAPGWLEGLARRLEDPSVGLAGCLTNRSGGENEIDAPYRTYREFLDFAEAVAEEGRGSDFDCEMLPLSCAAVRREVLGRVGFLDEGYGRGLCEDDDFCLRLRRAGYRITVAADCYIHHFGRASMGGADEYASLLARNRRRFERKWGVRWRPRGRRRSREYQQMIVRLREMVEGRITDGAVVAVVSRGDDELLRLGAARGVHFMQDDKGVYWGAHPADDAEIAARWRVLNQRGAEYLLIPATSFWWFDFYTVFQRFVDEFFELIVSDPEIGVLYRCSKPARPGDGEDAVS